MTELLDVTCHINAATRRRGQHDIRHLSDDARKAKQARRRLERRYREWSDLGESGVVQGKVE